MSDNPGSRSASRRLVAALLAFGAFGMPACLDDTRETPAPGIAPEQVVAAMVELPMVEVAARPPRRLEPAPITAELRNIGFHECYPPDPLGLGPYAPYRKVGGARIAIPQRGGHTEDLGYDVVVHFHGGDPVRKTLVQVARGVVFVAVDRGVGSGAYERAFVPREAWPRLRHHIERALQEHARDDRAHIRHLALSAWSAGYGAIQRILLTHGDAGIDAVVLLDALHAGKNPRWPYPDDGSLRPLSRGTVSAIFDFAGRAARGEKHFVLTHSNVVPTGYASVRRSAELLLHELHLQRRPLVRDEGLAHQLTAVDHGGLHIWGYDGRYEEAHCAHVSLIAPAVRDVLEPAWDTPAMDRDVPNTPAPVLGNPSR